MEYQHGGDIYTNCVDIDYSANINPLGLPLGVKEKLFETVDACSCYPDSRSLKLTKALAEFHSIPMDSIICGNGAADLIFQVVQAVKPTHALLLAPSFLEYEQALRTFDCNIAYYDLKENSGFRLRIQELEGWIEKQQDITFQMIFLCNPNNPTGFAIESEEMIHFLEFCKKRKIVCIVDECFNDFLDTPGHYSVLSFVGSGKYENVFVLKAFTKMYAMAGLRLGYGIGTNLELLESMKHNRQPWSVSTLAQAAGEAALKETEYVEKTRALITCEREFLKVRLMEMGFFVYDSLANYIFFKDTRKEAQIKEKLLYEQCLNKKVLIRSCANYRGLDGTYYRICVKQRKENEEFLDVLKTIVTEGE